MADPKIIRHNKVTSLDKAREKREDREAKERIKKSLDDFADVARELADEFKEILTEDDDDD